jgi:hypothetical protein
MQRPGRGEEVGEGIKAINCADCSDVDPFHGTDFPLMRARPLPARTTIYAWNARRRPRRIAS